MVRTHPLLHTKRKGWGTLKYFGEAAQQEKEPPNLEEAFLVPGD